MRFRLRSIFELAMSERVVEFNPATSLFTPRKCQPGRSAEFTPFPGGYISSAPGIAREDVVARLATWEGMRPGENRGPTSLRILKATVSGLDDAFTEARRTTPKNKRSARQVALTSATKLLLEEWIDRSLISDRMRGYFHPKAESQSDGTIFGRAICCQSSNRSGLAGQHFRSCAGPSPRGRRGRR